MGAARDKVTRFSAELVDAAAAEGPRQSRSARQQLDHWVRVGRAVSDSSTAQRRRVEKALSGRLPTTQLTREEAAVFNAEITSAIEENLIGTHYGQELAAAGVTTVALDDMGNLVQYHPDGSSAPLPAPS